MNNLLKYLQSLATFSNESWDLLQFALSCREYKKNEFLIQEGQVCNSLFYIDKGYCRNFFEIDGTEKNTAFYFENEIATNIKSFGSGEKSESSLITCEPSSIIVFDKDKLFQIAKESIEIEALGRNCIRSFTIKQEEFSNLFKLYSTEERFEYLGKNYPDILKRVPLTQLSSFLGVSRETLSRIRRKRVSK